jgi:hypothetical protein
MNDDGYRRLAEQLTAAIVSGLPKDALAHGTAAVAHNVGHGAGSLHLSGR